MKKIILMFLFINLICGCASVTKTYTFDGKEAYSLNCSGGARGWHMCYEKAGDLCGTRGYDIVSQDEYPNTIQIGYQSSTSTERVMVIKCKE